MSAEAKKDYYAVECGECNEPIPLKPVSTVNDQPTSEKWPEKMPLTCPHCKASDVFISQEVRVATIEKVPIDQLPKLWKSN
jgi:hypothetical protein